MALTTLEREVPFSESLIWKLQSHAYQSYGIDAWAAKGVPNYLTSHPLTARGYARATIGFLRDIVNPNQLTVLDIGAGTGKFAYLYLKELQNKINLPIRYIATDISKENLTFIRQHPMMQQFNQIEYMLYSHEDTSWRDEIIPIEGPLVVVTNYYFDTVPQKLYRTKNGILEEGYITTQINDKKNSGGADMIPHLECSFTYHSVTGSELIQQYAACLGEGSFMVPVGGLQTIDFIRNQVKEPLLWITADQGVCSLNQAQGFEEPKIARHGTFSVTVSYHFLHWYFQQYLGGVVLTTQSPDPAYVVLASVLGLGDPTNTIEQFMLTLDALDPIEYYRISEGFNVEASLDSILALIRVGGWDPVNTYLLFEKIRSKISSISRNQRHRVIYLLERVRENFYPISPSEGEFLMNLGVLFHDLEDYRNAIDCFEESMKYTGPKMRTKLNLASSLKLYQA